MSDTALTIRYICFTGYNKKPARVDFGPGLNIIYGASETGKSFIMEALDFMMGSSKELRDIPERVGYDRIWLGVEQKDGETFTIERSTSGGQYRCYKGLHDSTPEDIESLVLSPKHNPTNEKNLSNFLLNKIGLAGKNIKKNVRGETNSLSFRNLSHLCLITEGAIQKEGSPIESDQFTTRTAEMSVFKLLLTGVDDSALQALMPSEKELLSKSAKIEVIDELIADYQERLTGLVGEEDDAKELSGQLARLEESLAREKELVQHSEEEYCRVISRRNVLRRKQETANDRQIEVEELVTRFNLLDQHYCSDLARLEGVHEAGLLLSVLGLSDCPMCGAHPDQQHLQSNCDGNVDIVVSAADAESKKITKLRNELQDTLSQLHTEMNAFGSLMPQITKELKEEERSLKKMMSELNEKRASYSELIEKKAVVQNALGMLNSIAALQERRMSAESTTSTESDANKPITDLSSSTLDKFSTFMEGVLKSWNFPEADRVYFERTNRDFVISGKPRGSRGKGMRAITHAAFTVSLLGYILKNNLFHPGFIALDTPLLAYREPEGEDDDLTGTDVQDKFFGYLSRHTEWQTIILENADPPEALKDNPQTIFFSKNPHQGRYGFFPINLY
ncbi:MAG: hypothetical protein IPI17_06945 [Nitrosomonas sp.]|jgi:hypothetical protein|nr:hypothetical protein [Nitrosomonas sp.]